MESVDVRMAETCTPLDDDNLNEVTMSSIHTIDTLFSLYN